MMKNMKQLLKNLATEDSGQDLIEYALVAIIIALGAITAMGALSSKINSEFTNIGTKLT